MAANNLRIIFDPTVDKQLNIPIELKWDFAGQDESIEIYQEQVIDEVIGIPYDFEVNRFPHDIEVSNGKTEVNYEFYFYSGGSTANSSNWNISYNSEGLTNSDIYYFTNDFTRSFFKLDFYDTVDEKKQTNYFTIIIPTTQGYKTGATISVKSVDIKIPKFTLDYIGDKEGFFIYWLKELQFLNLNTFYMTAKFYNAKTGQFVKMMNDCQCNFTSQTNIQNFDVIKYFYYRVVLDYTNISYRIYDITSNQRVGTTNPIKWYEYVGP